MKAYLCLGFALLFLGCSTKSVNSETVASYPQTLGAFPFLTGGYNYGAVFAEGDSKVFFLSKNRRDHRNPQVYEYVQATRSTRRITFQDGNILGVAPAPVQRIMYASNTDELKETPFARDLDPVFPRSELYLSDVYGDEIIRLTETPGFDAEATFVESKKQVLFTSQRSGVPGLYWLNPADSSVTAFQVSKTPQHSATVTPDGTTIYWIEDEPSSQKQNIVRSTLAGKDRTVILSQPGVIKSLTVNAAGIIAYAWQGPGAEFAQINLYTPESKCHRVLLKSGLDFLEPSFSLKNPNLLLFRGTLKENSVVYRWELPEALGPCVQTQP